MKNFFSALASFAVLLALGAVIYHRLSPSLSAPPRAEAPAPIEASGNANQLPPESANGQYAMVNRQRLEALKADKAYRGPAYSESYEQPLNQRLGGEKKPSARVPAGK